ncbi:T9SS type A sorting domain-containing protein [Pontibacter sp. H249]|uniref:T9SS type A sorting domain-containing protein n=1 Tax=Pontibacter sp. H249 TaxID=3133420 RepID=UPI0030BD4872
MPNNVVAQTSERAVTEVITDFGGFWRSGNGALGSIATSAVKPNNSHNVLGFVYQGKRYSTGVDDAKLIANNITFTAGDFRSLPQFIVTGAISSNTKVGLGQMYDGVDNGKSTPSPERNINKYLQDGIKGLDLGTGVANLPVGSMLFDMTNILPSAVGDGVPDFIITQIADPSGSTDEYEFQDQNGARLGNLVRITFSDIPSVGQWVADFYEASTNPMTLTTGYIKTDRHIRLWAGDFSDFGLTSTDVARIRTFKIALKGSSDVAFVAYNANSFFNRSPINPMPVTLKSLNAKQTQGEIAVTWETASEENSSHFEVEASLDGKTFEKLGEVAAAGYSNVEQRYSFNFIPQKNSLYYIRLKQVDIDGTFERSKTINVAATAYAPILSLYPNPATGALVQLQHAMAIGNEKIFIYSLNGRKLLETEPEQGSAVTGLRVSSLPKGIYQIVWQSKTEVQTTKLLIK